MLIATWNVNSLRVRLPHLKDWLASNPVDVVVLQETKLPDPDFPREEIEALDSDGDGRVTPEELGAGLGGAFVLQK